MMSKCFFSKMTDMRIEIMDLFTQRILHLLCNRNNIRMLFLHIQVFRHILSSCNFSQSQFALRCISLHSDFIYLFSISLSLFLSFAKFQHIFNNAEHTIPRLSLRSILLIFCFKSVAPFLSLSLFFSFSSAFPFSTFLLICRDKAIRRVNIPSRKIQPQTTLESHRFVVSCMYALSQRKHDVRGLTRFFFFSLVFTGRSQYYVFDFKFAR